MIRHRMRRGVAIALASLVAATLSACVGIPTSGSVIAGRAVSEQEPGGVEFVPEGPVSGADQETILRGFVAAFNGSGDYEVAREFLSGGFAGQWNPRESVLVRTGSVRYNQVDDATMDYTINTSAAVDANGTYTAFPSAPQTQRFHFVQEEGEWRISSAPNGIVLSSGTFATIFSEHILYFLDPSRQSLVPDLRWFPGGTAATRIVSALLAGPPPWLLGAVGTAFPDGTQLTSPKRVAVDSDVAIVDLTADALEANREQRQLMRVQLEASLGRLASISTVSISVDGTPLVIADLGADAPQSHPQVDGRMLVFKDGQFGYYANGRLAPISQISEQVAATSPTDAILGAGGAVAATLGKAGVYIVVAAEPDSAPPQAMLVDPRPGLIGPSLDPYGYVWSAQRSSPASIRVFTQQGVAQDVVANLPAGAQIVSLDVSRDGARVAVLLDTDAGPRMMVSAIARDATRNFAPLSLGEPRLDAIVEAETAVDATWLDEVTVAALTATGGESTVFGYRIGGQRTSLGSPQDAISIVGGNGENALRVVDADGVVGARRGNGWQSTQVKVSFIAGQR